MSRVTGVRVSRLIGAFVVLFCWICVLVPGCARGRATVVPVDSAPLLRELVEQGTIVALQFGPDGTIWTARSSPEGPHLTAWKSGRARLSLPGHRPLEFELTAGNGLLLREDDGLVLRNLSGRKRAHYQCTEGMALRDGELRANQNEAPRVFRAVEGGRWVLVRCTDSTVLLDGQSLSLVREFPPAREFDVDEDHGLLLLYGGFTASAYRYATGEPLLHVARETEPILGLFVAHGGGTFFIVGDRGLLAIHRPGSPERRLLLQAPHGLWQVAPSGNGWVYMPRTAKPQILPDRLVWTDPVGQVSRVIPAPPGFLMHWFFLSGGRALVLAAGLDTARRTALLMTEPRGQARCLLVHRDSPSMFWMDPSRRYIVTGGWDRTLHILDLQLERAALLTERPGPPFLVAMDRTRRLLAETSSSSARMGAGLHESYIDRNIRVWSVEDLPWRPVSWGCSTGQRR